MRRDSLRLFELIQLPGLVMVLDIQITVSVVVNRNQMVAGVLVVSLMSIGNSDCCCLNSNTLLLTCIYNIYIYIYICIIYG